MEDGCVGVGDVDAFVVALEDGGVIDEYGGDVVDVVGVVVGGVVVDNGVVVDDGVVVVSCVVGSGGALDEDMGVTRRGGRLIAVDGSSCVLDNFVAGGVASDAELVK